MKKYRPTEIEPKWRTIWQESKLYSTPTFGDRPKKYVLPMFPYPSGAGMHIGHIRNYSISDASARYYRMRGFDVMHTMGWDAFGLPTENFAIKNKIAPAKVTKDNTDNFRNQLQAMGFGFDWDREINSTDPGYYKWTQWFFLLLFERGLAYKKEATVNWDPVEKTVLANEQIINGRGERSGAVVEKKLLNQWFFKITDYADRLLRDIDDLDWPTKIKAMQRNWIGKSLGAEVEFAIEGHDEKLSIFTTRIDTIYGATYMVLAPEHPLLSVITRSDQKAAVQTYVAAAGAKSEIERMETDRKKTGVFTGAYAINPATQQPIQIWVADYVLMGYGTGAIMAVPAHDQRDGDFARAFNLPIVEVVEPVTGTPQVNPEHRKSIVALLEDPETGDLLSINWGKRGGNLFIGGGIDDGEDAIEAAKREIAEETGYIDVELVSQTGIIHHHYFAHSKNVARQIEATGLHFKLKSHTQQDTQLEVNEAGQFTTEWLTPKQAEARVTDPLHRHVYDRCIGGSVYTGEGILVNSGGYDGMETSAARERMTGMSEVDVTSGVIEIGSPRQGAELRNTISAVITRAEDDKVLLIKWRQFGWIAPVVGGIDEGETPEQAAVREVLEETGLTVKAIKPLGDKVVSHFFAENKNVWRERHDQPVLLEVVSDKKASVSEEDTDKFELLWLSPQDALAQMTHPDNAVGIARHLGCKAHRVAGVSDADHPSFGKERVNYKMRDWLISRQRYWGAPIPIVHCPECGEVAVPKDQLPVELPDVPSYEPTGDGRSPLAAVRDWVETTCPKCGGAAERETDTMDGFACSSWYFLRYPDPVNAAEPFTRESADRWAPVDLYIGGAEHAVMHLLYARMWTKVMYDAGLVDFTEPFTALRNQGMILGPDGDKMSKSKGNVINPDDIIAEGYGADSLRLYELFIGPYDQSAAWNPRGIDGTKRFLNRLYALVQEWAEAKGDVGSDEAALRTVTHKAIKKVTTDMEVMGFNTAIASLMETVNELYRIKTDVPVAGAVWQESLKAVVQLLAPMAPHVAEELWHDLGESKSVHLSAWPAWDEAAIIKDTITVIVQVNGKLRTQLSLPADVTEDDAVAAAEADPTVQRYVSQGKLVKTIYVAGKLVNFVVR